MSQILLIKLSRYNGIYNSACFIKYTSYRKISHINIIFMKFVIRHVGLLFLNRSEEM
jgi:hypothetical protein